MRKMTWFGFGGGLVCGMLLASMGWAKQADGPKAEAKSETGWISDEACGAEHTKSGRADCVQKCWRGGAAVGHPEWKPQRAVFVADDTKTVWIVENPDAVKNFPAAHVRVSGKFDEGKTSVQVQTIEAVK